MRMMLKQWFLVASIAGSYPAKAETTGLWDTNVNYERTFQCPEAEMISPESAEEVQIIVGRALVSGRKVMAGTKNFNSQIDAACAGNHQIQITTERLNRILMIDEKKQVAKVQSGVRLHELNRALHEKGLAINMVAEGGFFSIGGMLGSGTHGSTLTQGASLSDYLINVTMVDGRGSIRTIEGQELEAVKVNLGVLGVVVDATLRVEPLKKVKATIEKGKDDEVAAVMKRLAENHYSANVAWFPGLQEYTATLYDFVPNDTPGKGENNQAELPDWMIKAFKTAYQFSVQPNRPIAECALAQFRKTLRSKSYFYDNGKWQKNPVGWSDQMQYFKCNKNGTCPWDILPMVIQGYAIAMDQLPEWVADVKKIIDQHSTFLNRVCFPLNGIYFRFGEASDAWIAPSYGRTSVFIDLEYFMNTRGMTDDGEVVEVPALPKNFHVLQEIEQLTLQKYHARPHWGKNQAAAFYGVGQGHYEKWQDFIAYKNKVDPLNTFSNPWWQRILDKESPQIYRFPSCARDGNCICETDSDCGGDLSCVSGKVWKKARICQKI
ncbi:FAD-binding protein [Pseudobacteriovorax antillogorgiicola]|uniref:FAD-dependent oxidoreductase n=1 Tax=Pseudobacteriovorax antillogorgiicola TaxID=1513793 RepID=A0A1Y6CFD0_9BACT|nr:FAD-binding protein [Pseudobacteriovorax antillogorgiicola]TCS49034.1 FAD-dependent oxidoreductase [Pseudobacteriovorax antillogorgiicola]SMF52714.1 FAD-dependent oxidoreductase [Pseudobacteriovorax antillogorgiicola]